MLFNLQELIDMVLMILVVGYIFKDMFRQPVINLEEYDPLKHFQSAVPSNFKFAVLVTAPAIILHELGHKFVAVSMGFTSVFHAAYTWLGIGLLLKLLNTGIIFFVPAYVSTFGNPTALQSAAISVAGPSVNLILWLAAWLLLKDKNMVKKYGFALQMTKQINLFLFIFNMIPIPPFDGGNFFWSLIQAFKGA